MLLGYLPGLLPKNTFNEPETLIIHSTTTTCTVDEVMHVLTQLFYPMVLFVYPNIVIQPVKFALLSPQLQIRRLELQLGMIREDILSQI